MNRAHRRKAAKQHKTPPKPQSATTTKPIAVTWSSNSPLARTGYGTQTRQVTRRLVRDGHAVSVAANFGLEGAGIEIDGVRVYPRGHAPYSDDVLAAYADHWAKQHPEYARLVVTLYDVWVYQAKSLASIPRILSWVPIDHQPCPPRVLEWCKRSNVTPVAMSRFGVKMLEQEGVECEYVPHAIESVFRPTPQAVFDSGPVDPRALMRVDRDAFVVMMNAANKGSAPVRKAFGEAMLAFSIFASTRPDAVLYLHTDKTVGYGGIDLDALRLGCSLRDDQVVFVDQFAYRTDIPDHVLAALYTTSDVLLAPSRGEGFGIPVVEAQACGTSVIVSDWTAQPELCGDGWVVGGQPEWDPHQGAWFFAPNVPEIVSALEKAYEAPRGTSMKAVEFAKQYDADTVYETQWKPILERAVA